MDLTYEILWIDDRKDAVKGHKEQTEEYLEELGFIPQINLVNPIEEKEIHLTSDKWNLIIIDYKLTNNRTGTDLIDKIRRNEQYTEIIFYSSEQDKVENEIKNLALEGVYWAGRDHNLMDKIKSIIDVTLKKVMDVNTMRGLVMAEVADLDFQMESIIKSYDSKIPSDKKKALQAGIVRRIKKSISGKCSKIAKLEEEGQCTLDGCLDYRLIDSDKRLRTVEKVCKDVGIGGDISETVKGCKKVLEDRNLLAHGRSAYEEGKKVIKSGEKIFKLKDAIEVRKSLKEQKDNFEKLGAFIEKEYK